MTTALNSSIIASVASLPLRLGERLLERPALVHRGRSDRTGVRRHRLHSGELSCCHMHVTGTPCAWQRHRVGIIACRPKTCGWHRRVVRFARRGTSTGGVGPRSGPSRRRTTVQRMASVPVAAFIAISAVAGAGPPPRAAESAEDLRLPDPSYPTATALWRDGRAAEALRALEREGPGRRCAADRGAAAAGGGARRRRTRRGSRGRVAGGRRPRGLDTDVLVARHHQEPGRAGRAGGRRAVPRPAPRFRRESPPGPPPAGGRRPRPPAAPTTARWNTTVRRSAASPTDRSQTGPGSGLARALEGRRRRGGGAVDAARGPASPSRRRHVRDGAHRGPPADACAVSVHGSAVPRAGPPAPQRVALRTHPRPDRGVARGLSGNGTAGPHPTRNGSPRCTPSGVNAAAATAADRFREAHPESSLTPGIRLTAFRLAVRMGDTARARRLGLDLWEGRVPGGVDRPAPERGPAAGRVSRCGRRRAGRPRPVPPPCSAPRERPTSSGTCFGARAWPPSVTGRIAAP